MQKFFYLKKKNQWSKPVNVFGLVFLIITRRIRKFTVIWHTGLCPKNETHPETCIHPSINAIDISFLPKWLFENGYGIPVIVKRVVKKSRKLLGIRNNYEKILEKPLEMPQLLENAIKKKLIPSIRAIHNFCSGGEYSIDLILIINGEESKVIKNSYKAVVKEIKSNYIEFQILLNQIPNIGGVLYKESYGLNNQLFLVNEVSRLRVMQDSVTNFSTQFPYRPQILRGQFTQMNQVVTSDYKNVYIRLIVTTDDKEFIKPISILDRSGDILFDNDEFNVHDSLMGVQFRTGSSYSEIIVNGKKYHYYSAQNSLLILECLDKNDIDSFKLEAEQIRLGLAFLCGNLYQGEAYYLSSFSDDFSEIEGVWYEKELDSILTINQIINPTFFFQIFKSENTEYSEKYSKFHNMFSNEIFANLCNAMLSEDEIQRAIKLIINGSASFEPIQKGALYSVAIETLTSFLSEKNKEKLSPIKDNVVAEKLLGDLMKVLPAYSDRVSEEGLMILEKKISHLNNSTNADKLTKPFEIYGLTLNSNDNKAIKRRDAYLHGRSPLDKKEQFELNKLALELHYLVSCLILKYIGYEGHVINLPIWIIYKDEKKLDELFNKKAIEEMELMEQMKKALELKNKRKFYEIKAKMKEYYSAHEVNNLVRFI